MLVEVTVASPASNSTFVPGVLPDLSETVGSTNKLAFAVPLGSVPASVPSLSSFKTMVVALTFTVFTVASAPPT